MRDWIFAGLLLAVFGSTIASADPAADLNFVRTALEHNNPIIIVGVPMGYLEPGPDADPAAQDDWNFYLGTFVENIGQRAEVRIVAVEGLRKFIKRPVMPTDCLIIYVRSRKEALMGNNCVPLEDEYAEPLAWMLNAGPVPQGYRRTSITLR